MSSMGYWAAITLSVMLPLSFAAVASESLTQLNEQLLENQARQEEDRAFAASVEDLSFKLANDLCYIYQFRSQNGLPLEPMTQFDSQRELLAVARNWSPEIKNSYAAHLMLTGQGAMNIFGLRSSDRAAEHGYLVLLTPSRFTEYLVNSRGFFKAFHSSTCRKLFTFDQFQDKLLRQDLTARMVVELGVAGGGALKLASMAYKVTVATAVGSKVFTGLKAIFTAKRVVYIGAGLTAATGAMLAHDLLLLKNRDAVVAVQPEMPKLEDSNDFLHIMVDEFYLRYRKYIHLAESQPELQQSTRQDLMNWTADFMKAHGSAVQARFQLVTSQFATMKDFSTQVVALQEKKSRGEGLTESERKMLYEVAFAAKLDLLIEFSNSKLN